MKITHITKNKNFVKITAQDDDKVYESTQRFYDGRRPDITETQWAEQAALNNLGVMIAQKAMSEYQQEQHERQNAQRIKDEFAARENEIIAKTFGAHHQGTRP